MSESVMQKFHELTPQGQLQEEIQTLKSQNERLVKALEAIVDADRRGELHRDPLDTDDLFKEAKALLAEIKPATVSVEARGANA